MVFALLVFLPSSLRIELPAGLPQLTIHRILIVVAFLFLIRNRKPDRSRWPIPNLRLMLLFGLSQSVSVVLSCQFLVGLKGLFSYALEGVVFYMLISEYLHTEGGIARLLSSICCGLAAGAILAAVEKYLHFNLVEALLPSSRGIGMERSDITSTYTHRIMLGYAMAMGVPLALALSTQIKEAKPRRVMYLIALLLIGAAYFSMSRGPWLGLGLGLVGMAALGGKSMRRKLAFVGLLAVVVVISRPGIGESIHSLGSATFKQDSLKAQTYQTRWELWTVAWKEIGKSPERFFFGYGPSSTDGMDLSDYWYGQEGWQASMVTIGHTSWDNNYACDLIELGVVGSALEVILFVSIVWTLVINWRDARPDTQPLQAGVAVAALIFMFAMTNVFIFAPQLKYLFWAVVAIGSNFTGLVAKQTHGKTIASLGDLAAAALATDETMI